MSTVIIDPKPLHTLSPHLFMQFAEPLGATDSSLAAGWDFVNHVWRPDLLEVLNGLSPGAIRWGGILTSYWKWREGVGDRTTRKPMVNYLWGGVESNQIGIDEILLLCELVGADPIVGVNFAADGRPSYISTPNGENRAGTPEEAADLVSYCNDLDNLERRQNGRTEPWDVRLWQLGNETSYPEEEERFSSKENVDTFLAFARAMRERDPSIKLIGWGDQERSSNKWWLDDLLEGAGEYLDYLAIHMMMQSPQQEDSVLVGTRYRQDYSQAWTELLGIYGKVEQKLLQARAKLAEHGTQAKLAITEGHLSLKPHNRSPLLQEWLSGLYHAKIMNLFMRHSDVVSIATLADFFGNAWTVNAVMIPSLAARPFLMPVGSIMKFYREHLGENSVSVSTDIEDLDLVATRIGNRINVNAINSNLSLEHEITLSITGESIAEAKAFTIAPGIEAYVSQAEPSIMDPTERPIDVENGVRVVLPAASVTVIVLTL